MKAGSCNLLLFSFLPSGNRVLPFVPFEPFVKWEQAPAICAFWAFCDEQVLDMEVLPSGIRGLPYVPFEPFAK